MKETQLSLNSTILQAIGACTTVIESDKKVIEEFMTELGKYHLSTFLSKDTLKKLSEFITSDSDKQDILIDFIVNIVYHLNMLDVSWDDVVKYVTNMRDSLKDDSTLPEELVKFYKFDGELKKETIAVVALLLRVNLRGLAIKTIEN